MKVNKLITNILLIVFALTPSLFTACDNDDDNSGNVVLDAFGPSPALRGGELTFIGKNLNKVSRVVLPDDIVIADIQEIDKERIRVAIPQDAQPGFVVLELSNGKKIQTKTRLTYTEPIEITGVSPLTVKAGEEITIEGDYLNLIQRVIFAEDVVVDCKSFTTWERAKITLNVPLKARTGALILADTAAIPIELTTKQVVEVILPSVAAIEDKAGMKPGETISISGENLDLVEEVVLPNDESVAFELKNDVITFVLPEDATDGVIYLEAFSGVEVPAVNLTIAVPDQLVADPAGEIKAGDLITVKGVNMELVKTLTFPNVELPVAPVSQNETQVQVNMPENAFSGDLMLNMASGKTVSVAISTLKPIVESYNPTAVPAGNDVTLTGTNLDLISSVTFTGDLIVEVSPSSATELILKVPVEAQSGALVLTMKNGETVTAPSLTVEKPECCYIPALPGTEFDAGTVLQTEVKNGNKLTGVQLNGIDVQYILMESQLYVSIPANTNGKTELKLISSNGEISYQLTVIGSNIIETIVYEGLHNVGNWNNNLEVDAAMFAALKTGMKLKLNYITNETSETWWQLKIMHRQAGWPTLDCAPDAVSYEYGTTEAIYELTANDVNNLKEFGLAMGGHEVTVTKVSLVEEKSQEQIVYQGPTDVGNWSGYAQIEASMFASAKVGQVVLVKTSGIQADVEAQGSLKTPNGWGQIAPGTEYFTITGDFELAIDDAILSELQQYGLIVGGKNYIIESVVVK